MAHRVRVAVGVAVVIVFMAVLFFHHHPKRHCHFVYTYYGKGAYSGQCVR